MAFRAERTLVMWSLRHPKRRAGAMAEGFHARGAIVCVGGACLIERVERDGGFEVENLKERMGRSIRVVTSS